jgi:hypothetical protein
MAVEFVMPVGPRGIGHFSAGKVVVEFLPGRGSVNMSA